MKTPLVTPQTTRKNKRMFMVLFGVALGMVAMGYAFVPLYRMFCEAVGIPVPSVMVGKVGEPKAFPTAPVDRTITIRFMANVQSGVPMQFGPLQRSVRVKIGQPFLTAYDAYNKSGQAMVGVAVHTVTGQGVAGGEDMSAYIDLQQCFCFEEQLYPAHSDVNLPLQFFVTEDLPKDVHTLVFGYTLFRKDS